MSLKNSDRFVVQRGGNLFQVSSRHLKQEYSDNPTVIVGANPPVNPIQGTLWWSTTEGNLFIWYEEDPSVPNQSAQWVDASPAFVEVDYTRLEAYLDQSVLNNAVSQIRADGLITVNPPSGKGVVTVGFNNQPFVEDQQRQDDLITELFEIVSDLQERIQDLEDVISNVSTVDGGYPNAEGVFNEPDTNGNPDNSEQNAEGVFDDTVDGGDRNAAGVYD